MGDSDLARPKPSDISEDLLRRSGNALFNGDFELFASCFALPQEMETPEGRKLVESMADLRAVFDGVRDYFRGAGVTKMERRSISARYAAEDRIEATHLSRLIGGGRAIQSPYPVFSVLLKRDGEWRVSDSKYAISDSPAHRRALSGALKDAAAAPE